MREFVSQVIRQRNTLIVTDHIPCSPGDHAIGGQTLRLLCHQPRQRHWYEVVDDNRGELLGQQTKVDPSSICLQPVAISANSGQTRRRPHARWTTLSAMTVTPARFKDLIQSSMPLPARLITASR
ncbi:hypothetical protein [Spirillospora sp. CA-294931]|uniref:hypothetical protein n=1 Tax=Spirillospora sp. CA-294931 TaxID=3240042 RepID=UPI003D8F118B